MSCFNITTLCSLLTCVVLNGNTAFADEKGDSKTITQKVEVEVQSSSIKSADDAEAETSLSGRIVIVGPDGERKEYNLDDNLPGDLKLNLNSIANGFVISPNQVAEDKTPRYMIGVDCQPVDKVLRSHLKLNGVGLVVKRLASKMPAAKAGLAEGDILIGVGGQKFKGVKDLITAVAQSAGQPLTFQRIHQGEVSDIAVTPIESNTADVLATMKQTVGEAQFHEMLHSLNLPNAQLEMLRKLGSQGSGVVIQSFGPGIELDDAEDFEEKFARSLADSRRNPKKATQQSTDDGPEAGNESEDLKQLKQQIEENQAQLAELMKRLKSSESSQ